jgi:uncharacterized membrane protein
MRHALLALAALALCACQPQAPDGERAPPPADAPDVAEASQAPEDGDAEPLFAGDIDARGTEPFWAVQIRGDRITLTRPEPEPPVSAANPGATETGSEAVWSTMVDGKPFIVTLANEGTCSDGMSDFEYPYVAVVTLGELTFRGCAVKTSALPPERGR